MAKLEKRMSKRSTRPARTQIQGIRAKLGNVECTVANLSASARQAWLQPTHRHYVSDKRLRLLLAPFTPEELIATIDRAIDEASC